MMATNNLKGKITAEQTLSGKVNNKEIYIYPELEELTVTPSTENQEFVSSKDGFSSVIVAGEPNLKPENIKSGWSIFGVDGTNADTTDADATSDDIAEGKTAYVNNKKVVGAMTINKNNALISGQLEKGTSAATGIYKLIKKIPNDITISGTSAAYLLYLCTGLETIPKLDTSNITTMTAMLKSCTSLREMPELDTSNVVNMSYMLQLCSSLVEIPQLNTSKVTNMAYMLSDCASLVTIPLLDTSAITSTGMNSMFANSPKLSSESLNNILQMCINAILITSSTYKKLKYVGLTEVQATICTTLSNYQAFLDAGWVTGYSSIDG